jgi:hypothetical protein
MKALIQIFVTLLLTLNNGRGKTGVIPSLAFSYDANGNMVLGWCRTSIRQFPLSSCRVRNQNRWFCYPICYPERDRSNRL